jgi:hypothetical protein
MMDYRIENVIDFLSHTHRLFVLLAIIAFKVELGSVGTVLLCETTNAFVYTTKLIIIKKIENKRMVTEHQR